MTKKKKIVVGIDLGTTNSLISHIRDQSPRIIPNERGSRMTPSVVYFKEDSQVIVGELAKNQAVLNSEKTISNVKLSMGKNQEYQTGGKKYTPAEISGFILKNLKQYAEKYIGQDIEDAVITVPAYFDDKQREDTLKAAQTAGLNVLKLLNEPTAAALTYGFSKKQGTRLLVIDFGGGTLDITLMEYKDKVFRVRGVGGSTSIGGTDFDKAIVEHVLKNFEATYDLDLRQDRIAFQQLVIHAEKTKTDLSSTEETQIMIPYITATSKGPIHLNMHLTRETLESLIAPTLREIEDRIRKTFEQAKLSPEWVETAILVGGSTRVPAVEELIRTIITQQMAGGQQTAGRRQTAAGNQQPAASNQQPATSNQQLKKNVNPDEAVARGAGILAGILEGSLNNIEFHDITPHDLGVEDDHGEFVTVLPRGTAYPAQAFRFFTTTQDFQKEVCIHVLQKVGTATLVSAPDDREIPLGPSLQKGDELRDQCGANNTALVSLGWFRLKTDETKKRGETNIDVTFSIDANGLLNVSAVDIDSGELEEITIIGD